MAWTNVTLFDGTTVELYLQQFANECGPSCVATIVRMLGISNIDTYQARRAVGDVDHNRPPTFNMGHDWSRDWAYMTSLAQALSQFGVRMAYTRKNQSALAYETFCEGRSLKNPAILRVVWQDNSGHFVVTVGKNKGIQQSFIEILDPWYGLQRVAMNELPLYKPRNQQTRAVVARGSLDRNWSTETT